MGEKDDPPRELSRAQQLLWTVMAVVTILVGFAYMSSKFDFSDPVVAAIFVVSMFAVVYAERRWIATSTDSDGRPRKRR
ncbi:MAG: hypothetical protein K8F93_09275 [Burkholderiales bacterium]|nr:hypothetical protein [Burkholderiales bacterium]